MGQFGWNIIELWLSNPLLTGSTFIILIFLDFKLTRLGFALSQQGYSKHVKSEIYELNPFHQTEIHHNKPFKRRTWFIIGIILLAVMYLTILYSSEYFFEKMLIELVIGFLFFLYLDVILVHLGNILHFRILMNNPDAIQGKIEISAIISYGLSQQIFFQKGLLWFIIFILINQYLFLGGFIASLFKVWIARRWKSKVTDQINRGVFDISETHCPICKKKRHPQATYCIFCGTKLT